jgi:parvulin-like peptidyl-prolyl isomerase
MRRSSLPIPRSIREKRPRPDAPGGRFRGFLAELPTVPAGVRASVAVGFTAAGLACGIAGPAWSQARADGGSAADGDPAGDPLTRVDVGAAPTVGKPPSRPDGWPGAPTGAHIEMHVLSSIRKQPGGPLIPLPDVEPISGGDDDPGGVRTVGFEEPAGGETDGPRPIPSVPEAKSLETARVVARVGPQVVLESDLVTPSVAAWLSKVKSAPGVTPEQVREVKDRAFQQLLGQYVESLIVFVDATRTIPEERLPEIEQKVNEAFDQQQLPKLMEEAGVTSIGEYEQLLRAQGQSLERVRRVFFERALAQQWIEQKVAGGREVPHADLIAYYQEHLADYEYPARARFEQLTVRVGGGRSREQAWQRLAEMGNAVLGGRPFAEVARESSEGPTARNGGLYDWTTKGSLASDQIDEAVFTLPIGQMSRILEEDTALHIVRVVERREAGRESFVDAQVDIRRKLMLERRNREVDAYLARLRDRTPVWTIYDEPAEGSTIAGRPTTTR